MNPLIMYRLNTGDEYLYFSRFESACANVIDWCKTEDAKLVYRFGELTKIQNSFKMAITPWNIGEYFEYSGFTIEVISLEDYALEAI
jgi:hypothetical protein